MAVCARGGVGDGQHEDLSPLRIIPPFKSAAAMIASLKPEITDHSNCAQIV